MVSQEKVFELFRKSFFKDNKVHDSSMNYLHGKIQSAYSIEANPEIDEYFVQKNLKEIVEIKAKNICNDLKAIRNKSYDPFKTKLKKKTGLNLNPEFDLKVVDLNNNLLALYEVAVFFHNPQYKEKIFNDVYRLTLASSLFPDAICVLILAGLREKLRNFFISENLPFLHNITEQSKTLYRWIKICVDNLSEDENDYLAALKYLKIKTIGAKLSRTQSSFKFHCLSYIVRNEG